MKRIGLRLLGINLVMLALVGCGDDSSAMNPATATAGTSATTPPGTAGTTTTGAAGAPGSSTATATAGRAGSGTGALPTSPGSSTTSAAGSSATTGAAGATTGTTSAAGAAATAGAGAVTSAGAGASAGGAGGSGAAGSGSTPSTGASCLDGITEYEKDGPFKFDMKRMGAINFWVPMVPAGCKVPVVHLANGTGATCSAYAPALERIASHGFLTACYEDPNTGAGTQGLMAFEAALSMFPDLADQRFGSTGHSQGGQSSFVVQQLAEAKFGDKAIYAGLAMEPASGFGTQPMGGSWQSVYAKIKSPMFMFSGVGTDGLVSQAWVQQAYDALDKSEEAYFWAANGATHIPVPNGEEQEISIPWFRWKLLGDNKACEFFKNIPMTDTKWMKVASKNEKPCM